MADIRTINLGDSISSSPRIKFLQAEMSTKYRLPLVRVVAQYALNGKTEERGLRLDTEKRSFLDHFSDPEIEAISKEAAPQISQYLGEILYDVGKHH